LIDYYINRDNDYDTSLYKGLSVWKKNFYLTITRILFAHFDKNDPNIRLIEIGCGNGEFIDLISKMSNWKVKGFEPCINVNSKHIINKDFLKSTLKDKSVDIIFSASVIEHIYDIDKLFTEVNRILKTGGIFVSTGIPNLNSLSNITKFKNFDSDCPPTHVNYFNTKTMEFILKTTGFKEIMVKSYGLTNKLLVNINKKESDGVEKNSMFKKFLMNNIFNLPMMSMGDKIMFVAKNDANTHIIKQESTIWVQGTPNRNRVAEHAVPSLHS